MIKKLIVLCSLLLLIFTSASVYAARKVWDYPVATLNPRLIGGPSILHVAQVEFLPDETVVHIRVWGNIGRRIKFAPSTSLRADGNAYALRSIDGRQTDEWIVMPPTGVTDIALRFDPLPDGTESFDFIEGKSKGAFNFTGIHKRDTSLESSNWRDAATGDWVIGFYPEFAVYDTHVWNYVSKDFDNGNIVMTDGNSTLKVKAGKEKSGHRKLRIGDREITATRILGASNDPYPADGGVTAFKDNGYRTGDSVTISGYIKGMTKEFLKKSKEISVNYEDMFTDEKRIFSAPIDSNGCFRLTFPVPNTQTVYFDRNRFKLNVPVEPGEEYFFFCDLSNNQRLWMGSRSRLLNELTANSVIVWPEDLGKQSAGKDIAASLNAFNNSMSATIDSVAAAYPTLSPLWARWLKEYAKDLCSFYAGQSLYKSPTRLIPDEVNVFIEEKLLPSLPEIPTAYNPQMLCRFLRDLMYDRMTKSPYCLHFPASRDLRISIRKFINPEIYEEVRPEVESLQAAVDTLEIDSPEEAYVSANTTGVDIFNRLTRLDSIHGLDKSGKVAELKVLTCILDSLDINPFIRDLVCARVLTSNILSPCEPLPEEIESKIDSFVKHPTARQAVHDLNTHYQNLTFAEVETGTGIMVPAEELCTATSGKELLDKALEPFRGHPVLIDFWGTWCGPCKLALSEFAAERAKLDKFGVIYMFFANHSKEQGWKNVINELGVTGDNVVHYNLPADKQDMLENYLNVNSFPSYRLFNTDGSLLPVDADPRFINGLVNTLTHLTGQ